MSRNRRHILLLTALLHFFADAAFAGGAVFCVGPNDHRALEVEHHTSAGCEAATPRADASPNPLPNDCSDTSVHPETDIASRADRAPDFAVSLVALPNTAWVAAPTTRVAVRLADLRPCLLAHRTVVLLL